MLDLNIEASGSKCWDDRVAILLSICGVAVAGVFALPPMPQNPAYHRFADTTTVLGIPNGLNVLSNLAFVLVGGWGLGQVWRYRKAIGAVTAPLLFYAGIVLTGFGSGYYHLAPRNETLLWDRLPMALAFMAFLILLIGDYISTAWGRRLLLPFLAAGLGSVWYWHVTEQQGYGDLRPYLLVQFLPMLIIPLILLLYPVKAGRTGKNLWPVLGFYVLAKIAENWDAVIYADTGGWCSGHTLKHLLAATGSAWVVKYLHRPGGNVAAEKNLYKPIDCGGLG